MDLVPALCVGGDWLLLVYINQQVNEIHGINNVKTYTECVFSFFSGKCLSPARGREAP
jgi:hypothetical protein